MSGSNVVDSFPLSPMQEGMLFNSLFAPHSGVDVVQMAMELHEHIEVGAFEQSWQRVLNEQPALRTCFRWEGVSRACQDVHSGLRMPFRVEDWSAFSPAEQDIKWQSFLKSDRRKGFSLSSAPLTRVTLFRLFENDYRAVWTFHHALFDGRALTRILKQAFAIYDASIAGLPDVPIEPPGSFRAYVEWLDQRGLSEDKAFWRNQLAGIKAATALPLSRDADITEPEHRPHKEHEVRLSPTLTASLRELASANSLTLNTVIQGAWAILLSRYSGQQDVVFGAPKTCRKSSVAGAETTIGLFLNTLPLRVEVRPEEGLVPWLKDLRARWVALRAYEHTPLVKIQEWSDVPSGKPLFETIFGFENYQFEDALRAEGGDWANREIRGIEQTSFPLALLGFAGHELLMWLDYDPNRFDDDSIQQLLGHLATLLEEMVADPERCIGDLCLLSPSERTLVLSDWNATTAAYAPDRCVPALFEQQAARTPDALAVACNVDSITYGELNARANQLAWYLRDQGVGPEVLVAVCMDRGIDLIVALLGILKAGGAYVPLDPIYPAQRLAFMLSDSAAPVLVTVSNIAPDLPSHEAHMLCLDDATEQLNPFSKENPPAPSELDALAYVIYTSGSTGQPKGVQIEHGSLLNLVGWHCDSYDVTPADRATQLASVAFDASVWELWPYLTSGASLHIPNDETRADPSALMSWLVREHITLCFLPTPLAASVFDLDWPTEVSLRWMLTGGDKLRRGPSRVLPFKLVNHYGPTESTVVATCADVAVGVEAPPIGRPIGNTSALVLDERMQPVPVGVIGELYLGGASLARGYLNRPELTAERFVANPFVRANSHDSIDNPRLYKTGDLVCWNREGQLSFVGRNDDQVKIRGYRIELGEIETTLARHAAIEAAVVMPWEDEQGTQRLVAYVVQSGETGDEDATKVSDEGLRDEYVSEWQSLYDETYRSDDASADPTFNITGWNSTYTGEPIPADEMREWVETTTERILAGTPHRVLEIGCGTGLLLFRVAPPCEVYWATDFSGVALDFVRKHWGNRSEPAGKLTLLERMADDFQGIQKGYFDTVVLNSVVQYFPSISYLVKVLEGAVAAIGDNGRLFVGDVRSLPLLATFHASTQLYGASDEAPLTDIRRRTHDELLREHELVIHPDFFRALQQHIPSIRDVQIVPKRGSACNELTKYRYDVVLQVGAASTTSADTVRWMDWKGDGLSLTSLREQLSSGDHEQFGVTGVPNARTLVDSRGIELLFADGELATVGDLRKTLAAMPSNDGIEPESLWDMASALQYTVHVSWPSAEGELDVLFHRRKDCADGRGRFPRAIVPRKDWSTYANRPLQGLMARQLAPRLRTYLGQSLPDYMVPHLFVPLEAFPLSPHGKLDRAALPPPLLARSMKSSAFIAPSGEAESILAEVWSQVLGVERVGIHDNFFDLGGDSILSIQIVSRAKQAGLKLTPKDVFRYQTIAELATTAVHDGLVDSLPAHDPVTGATPLTPIQRWFFETIQVDRQHFHHAMLLALCEPVDPPTLQAACAAVVAHHDALRLCFHQHDDGWHQLIPHAEDSFELLQLSTSAASLSEWNMALIDAEAALLTSFDLTSGPLFGAALVVNHATQEQRLLLLAHHLLIDGISWRILMEDLESSFLRLLHTDSNALPPRTTAFTQWATALATYATADLLRDEASHWLALDARLYPPLPTDSPTSITQNIVAHEATVATSLDPTRTAALLGQVPVAFHARIDEVLLTALARAFAAWTGDSRLIITLEGHGREDIIDGVDLSRTVGWFTSMFPLGLNLGEAASPGEAVNVIKNQLRRVPGKGLGYGLLRHLGIDLVLRDALAAAETPAVSFNYLGQFDQMVASSRMFSIGPRFIHLGRSSRQIRASLLEINCWVAHGCLSVDWTYCTRIHNRSTIEHLAAGFLAALADLAEAAAIGHTGLTPTDFPLTSVSAAELDRLLNKVAKAERQ